GVARDVNALGYFGMAYYLENQDALNAVAVNGVVPSPETIEEYVPLARPIFIYVNTAELDDPNVQAFVEYYLNNAGDIAGEVGYVALPDSEYEAGLAAIQ
ncbi:MAG: protein sphX, partial [Cyanobacteria bacterium J06632_22]